jgi:hypothetical protein
VHDTFFNTLLINSPFQKIAEHLLGEPVAGKNLQYFNNSPVVSQPTPPHQDEYYFMIVPVKAVTQLRVIGEQFLNNIADLEEF